MWTKLMDLDFSISMLLSIGYACCGRTRLTPSSSPTMRTCAHRIAFCEATCANDLEAVSNALRNRDDEIY